LENILKDPKLPPTTPKDAVAANIKDVENLLDRLEAAVNAPNSDPRKLTNIANAIGNKIAPLIQNAKKEIPNIKDPQERKKAEDAIKKIEKDLPRLLDEVRNVAKDPTPENKQKVKDTISDLRPPLADLQNAIAPARDPVVDAGNKAKAEVLKIANAAKNNDPKAAEDSMKQVKDLLSKFAKAAKDRAQQAPPKLKEHMEQKAKEVEDKIKALEPTVLAFSKKPNDPATKDAVLESTKNLVPPIEALIEDLVLAANAPLDKEQEEIVKQILAAIKSKNIKKIDPSHLLKISKHLAGLLSDMVSKTGENLSGQSDLSDRARAALELERLLTSLEKDASRSNPSNYDPSQSIDSLLTTLNLSSEPSTGVQTHLSQQIASVAKQIRTKTDGSIEGTQLHVISQGLAADLQKFADADSGNSRSELILLGRAISANIVRLSDELKRLAANCKDPKMQDQLLLNSAVMRNYATQLKIMASVRAASPRNSRDSSSDQLVILTQNVAAVIGDTTRTVSIMKQTKMGTV